MLISLSEIMNLPKIEKEFTVSYDNDSCLINGDSFDISEKDDVNIRIKNLGGKRLHINAKSRLVFRVPCDRCLEMQNVEVPVSFSNEIDMNLSSEDRAHELNDTEYISGYDLDVDRLIYEEILLGFPMKVLCDESCKGICRVCGANLNKGECGCDRTELDPRMSVIRDIFNQVKEV